MATEIDAAGRAAAARARESNMWQVLFRIPIHTDWAPDGIPIYGFGVMLFLTYVIGIRLAIRRARAEGVSTDMIQDIAIVLFIGGIVGARATYLIAHEHLGFVDFLWALPRIWDGGIILYGSVIGALVTWGVLWVFIYRKRNISTLQLADIYAPSIALGVCLGRLGCLCNGCCYGQVACESCPGVGFPLPAAARYDLTHAGLQTTAGFTMENRLATVDHIEGDPERTRMREGDVLDRLNGTEVSTYFSADHRIAQARLRGKDDLEFEVLRGHVPTTYRYRMPPLGFTIQDGIRSGDGPTVQSVEEGHSAHIHGLREKDRIVRVRLVDFPPTEDVPKVLDMPDIYRALVRMDHPELREDKKSWREWQLELTVWRRALVEKDVTADVVLGAVNVLADGYEERQETLDSFKVPQPGFSLRDVTTRVGEVEPGSSAYEAGLRPGDSIVAVNEVQTESGMDLHHRFWPEDDQNPQGWRRGDNELRLRVVRHDKQGDVVPDPDDDPLVKPFVPRTIPLHPTQIYESISMLLLFLVLLAYTPLRTSCGQVLAVLAIGYSAHRYLNELLRNDVRPGMFELVTSVVILVVGVGLYAYLRHRFRDDVVQVVPVGDNLFVALSDGRLVYLTP